MHAVVRAAALSILAAVTALHCGVTQPVRVLEPGEVRIAGSVGGPVAPSAFPTGVVPYATAGVLAGLSQAVTVTGTLHLGPALLGTAALGGGAAVRLVREHGACPEVTAKAEALLFTDLSPGSFRLFPFCSVNGSYALGSSVLGYAGVESMFQFTGTEHVLLGPFAGAEVCVSRRIALQAEAKWMAANVKTRNGIFEGQSSFRNMGSFGFFLGTTYVW